MSAKAFLLPLLFLLAGCGTPEQTSTNGGKKYHTLIYFQNMSDSEAEVNLKIKSTDSTVFDGSVAYNGIEDSWHERDLKRNLDIQHISIVNKNNGVRLDTVVTSTDTLTHVFLTYSHHVLTHKDSVRFKANAHDAEELHELYKMFFQPGRFSVLVMSGQISIP
jgi:hypothetical protein